MKPDKASKCDVCATPYFERNNYFYGKQFTVRDLFQEQAYFNEKRHLVNRMVLGWGVVCGLDVRWLKEERQFVVDTGLALDCCGREIVVCEPQHVPFDDYEDQCRCAQEEPEHEGRFVLCLEYDDCYSEPVELPAVGCDEQERTEFNRVRDGFKLRIKRWEDACPKQPYDHIACLNRFKHDTFPGDEEDGEKKRDCDTETIHRYLCRKLKKGCPECEGCDCVVLATIDVRARKPGQGQQSEPIYDKDYQQGKPIHDQKPDPIKVVVDTCTDRRLVYKNSLLYDLIYCHHGDLPHIVDFNWRKPAGPKRQLDWPTFVNLIKNGLTVYFDQKMEKASLNRHTFFITFFHEDPDSGNLFVKRLPAKEINTGESEGCYTATWVPDPDWVKDELDSPKSQLRGGVDVEINLLGSRIWDSRGKGLDGAFLAERLPTGNGTQGTEFIDWFRVLKRDDKKDKGEAYKDF